MDNLSLAAAIFRGIIKLEFPPALETIAKAIVLGYAVGVTLGVFGI